MRLYASIYIVLAAAVVRVSCECGIVAPSMMPNVLGLFPEVFPWNVLIYQQQALFNHVLLCSGTLISADVVVSAANCFYGGSLNTMLVAGSLFVAAGKRHQFYNHFLDANVQKTGVESFHVAEGFQGSNNYYAGNVIWFVLKHPFITTPAVRPICIDLENQQGRQELRSGEVGKVMNWIPFLGLPSGKLQMMDVSVISYVDCLANVVQNSRIYITPDKICISLRNGIAPSFVIPGSGFYHQRNGRWYLRGIVGSTFLIPRVYSNDLVVPIANFRNFVTELERNTTTKNCGIAGPPASPLIVNGFMSEPGWFPWHVAVYGKNSNRSYEQICAGSLISENVIISAAHCFYNEGNKQKMNASEFAVAAGKLYRLYNWPEKYVQRSEVESINLPSRYSGMDTLYAGDIAWLVLKHPFHLSFLVRPICIDSDNSHESEDLQVGKVGKIVGWGATASSPNSNQLQEMNAPYVPYEGCVSAVPSDFRPFLTPDKFCAGYLNGTSLCGGDSGGGLVFYRDNRWYLRGIVSVAPHRTSCNSYTAFTNVGHFTDEIYSFTASMK